MCDCPAFCFGCGRNWRADKIIERDGFTLDPLGAAQYEGQPIPGITTQMVTLLHTLAAADGRRLPPSIIAERCGARTEDPANAMSGLVWRMRHKVLGDRCPVTAAPAREGGGYWWAV